MIPVFWRYAISHYIKIFSLTIGSIVSILIVSRFKEIANFAVLTADWSKTALFTLFQIPFILPMALPLSALLASFLLVQKMSKSHETTALRAAGFGLRHILMPLFLIAGFFTLLNFTLSLKITPLCTQKSLEILVQDAPTNPFDLLKKRKLLKQKNIYLQLQEKEDGITDFILAVQNGRQRLKLLVAERLQADGDWITGTSVAVISHRGDLIEGGFHPLLIENQRKMAMNAPIPAKFFKKGTPKMTLRTLDVRMLWQAMQHHKKKGKAAFAEILQRSSLSLAVFTFTLLGAAFGFESGRKPSKTAPIAVLFWALTLLASYFLGKGLRFDPGIAIFAFFLPHILIWLISCRRLQSIAKGNLA